MAGPGSNFSEEIKKGMQPKGAKSSTNAAPSGKPPKASGKFNAQPKATTDAPAMQDQTASPVGVTSATGNTHQAMLDAGQAHMSAIHAHINAMKNGGGMM